MHMALKARRWTRSDLDRLPDDGNRYEVIDGQLLVTPPPSVAHEEIVASLAAFSSSKYSQRPPAGAT
jgi:Uma2 family endonuclease